MAVSAARRGAGIVLVVEDEPLIRLNVVDVLEDEGFEVIEAGNGEEGLCLLRANPDIGVLFTDINMPGSLDGLALAWIAASDHRHVRLLIVSGKVAPVSEQLPAGACFLRKPYDVSAVVAYVHGALGG